VAQGRHADLMESSAIYAEIYRSQLVEDPVPQELWMVKELAGVDPMIGGNMIGDHAGFSNRNEQAAQRRADVGPAGCTISRPFWLALLGVLLMMVVNAWVQVLTPELLGQAVDCYLTPAVDARPPTRGMAQGAAGTGDR
jgi:hypothetical protein